ncbi:DUF456 domain-containing protein [Bacillus luteolus]|uniref:DUF456 domain-containing protein n=1 Tax=Litchfieldia luteola TaxID=682179 RepID=A0ABR9QHL3_9BACI|nr:DUF456 domain-containing protein [Cytobacillus luteolus]MBE4907987.1 DUF456 domain-containing protein [Cytobacillus luteolus]MBP1942769.1 uncharacterized protein YqgC (DUF456 family) [Cytobacillus luteolus]
MDILYWILIIACFIISFIGLVYPIIPSVVFIALGIAIYGFAYGFDHFSILFWSIQILFFILLLAADYLTNLLGVKKFGGSKAAIWGSTIGLLVGPFVIPVAGIIIGPFAGAIIGELIVHKTEFKKAVKIGIGSLLGFLSGVITKGIIQAIMIGYFLVVVL